MTTEARLTAYERWERKSAEIDKKLSRGIYSPSVALRLHITNDRLYDDAARLEERTAAGLAIDDVYHR